MKFLFNYKIIVRQITWLSVVFKVLFHHLVSYISRTPCSISDCPKVPAPIPLLKQWVFFLKSTRTSPLQPLHQIAYRFRRRIFNMDMHMIFAHYSLQYFYILSFTDLTNYISATNLYIPHQNRIPIFYHPNYVHCQPRYCMTTVPGILAHLSNLRKCVATESLALKVHSFN